MNNKYKNLFTPVKIGSCEIKNRFSMAPMGALGLTGVSGEFTQRGIDYYVERAKGGTGLIHTGMSFVEDIVEGHAMPSSASPSYNPLQFGRTGTEMCERIHAYGAKIFIQLSAGFGRVLPPGTFGDHPSVAPSPVMNRWADVECRAISTEEVKAIIKGFGKSAAIAKKAGFDGVQIHAVHEGYLLDQFSMELFNHRTDEYGGSLENRMRFAKEIVEEIKKICGADYPVTVRFSPKSFIKALRSGALPGEEFEEKGRDLEEGLKVAKMLEDYGYDALDVDVGSYDSWFWSHPPMYMPKGMYRPFAKMVKEVVNIPVLCAGRMDDPDMALEALEDGTTDIIELGRPLLADPDYVNKLRAGLVEDIRPCISCQEGCMGRVQKCNLINCAVNPQAAREKDHALNPILKPKKVMIIGGGVGGCEAARVLALRGHKPELYDRGETLGGKFLAAGAPDFKDDDIALCKWYAHTLEQLEVPVHLNTEVTKDDVLASDADVVIIATGAKAKKFRFTDNDKVYAAEEVLLGQKDAGDTTVVIGGGLVGCETALWLAREGKKVTIVEALDALMAVQGPSCSANKIMLNDLIPFNGIEVNTKSMAKDYVDGVLTINTPDGEKSIECDSVILAVGFASDDALYKSLEFDVPQIYNVGDSKKFSNAMYAIWDAYEVANHI